MPPAPRTLATLAFALGAAADREAALLAFAESVAELDRSAQVALFRYEPRREAPFKGETPVHYMMDGGGDALVAVAHLLSGR